MCSKVCQNVPREEDGNSESSSSPLDSKNALYKYDFVLNNYTEDEVCQVKDTISKICKKGGFGFEIGENGTPHLQGYLSLKIKQRYTGLHKLPGFARASFRKVRNEEALIEYIKKDGNYWLFGFPKEIKLITPNKWWQQEILEIIKSEANNRTIYWYWSKFGGVGKSQFVKYCVVKHNTLYFDEGKKSDIMNVVINADESKLDVMMVDLPRSTGNHVSYKALESLKNGLIYSGKYEGGYRVFNSPHIFVFANQPPKESTSEEGDLMSTDKWVIKNIDEPL